MPSDLQDRVLRTLLHSQYGLLLLDDRLDVVWVSEAGVGALRHTVDEVVGRNATEFLDPAQGPGVLDAVAALLQAPGEGELSRAWNLPERVTLRCGDGVARDFEFGGRLVEGEPAEVLLVFQDVSERVRLEDVLTAIAEHDLEGAVERFLRLAAEQLQTGVGLTLHPSLGGSSHASVGARPSLFEHLDDDEPAAEVRAITAPGGSEFGWLVVDRADMSAWDTQSVDRLAAVLAIVLANQATFTHLVDAAATDALTGLSNRRVLDVALAAASLNPARGWAMLYCDLDRFKAVNDVHGHDAGDAVLRVVGERLRHVVRSDDVIARMGGDEFVVLAHADRSQAEHLVARVRRSIAEPIVDRLGTFEVGVSIGLATATTAAEVHGLLTATDDAMRADKARRGATGPQDR
jgi:diguanylate cyclase (GGDEF)-like protein